MKAPFLRLLLSVGVVSVLTGCGTGPLTSTANPAAAVRIGGTIHGGQQAVSGSTIQLYTVGTTGDASAAQPLLTTVVTTDANGSFAFSGNDYSCDNATQVYLTATGGNPGLSAPNPNLVMMAALGPCSALSASTHVSMNELTTVAAAYALAPYATSATMIGSGTSDAAALAQAFTLANEYVNTATGLAPGVNIPTGYNDPTQLLDTLANVLSACINTTGGVANDNTTMCGSLFGLTPSSSGTAPTDTFTSMLNLAKNPGTNTAAIFNLAPAIAPFQPVLPQVPTDFNVRITSASGSSTLYLEPSTIFFGDEAVNSLTEYASFELVNSTTADVTIRSFNIIGPAANDFGINYASCPAGNLLSSMSGGGEGCSFVFTAKPTALGERLAYLEINSSAPDSPNYVKLYLSGTNVLTTPAYIYQSTDLLLKYNASSSSGYAGLGGGGSGSFNYGALRTDYVGNLYTFSQLYPLGSGFAITSGNVDNGDLPIGTGSSTFNPTPPAGYSFNGGGTTLSATTNFAADNQGQIYIPIQTSDAVPQLGIAVYPPNSTGVTAPSFVINGYGGKVAVDTVGTLYALDSTGEINFFQGGVLPGKGPVGGDPLGTQLGTGAGARVIDMATDGNNDVISLIYGTNGYEVVAYSTDQYGRSLLHKTFFGAISQLNQPTSIAADGVGNIYVNDTSATSRKNVILVFAGNGGDANTAPSAVIPAQGAIPPRGIAVR